MTHDDIVQLIEDYYAKPGNGSGGNLHVLLDDQNVDSVEFCRDHAAADGDADGVAICDRLAALSLIDRWDTIDPNGVYHRMGTAEEFGPDDIQRALPMPEVSESAAYPGIACELVFTCAEHEGDAAPLRYSVRLKPLAEQLAAGYTTEDD
jgi:hypothetical protein